MNLSDVLFARALLGISGGSAMDDGFYLKWDGNTEGRDVIELSVGVISLWYYKVSDTLLTEEQVNGAEVCYLGNAVTCVASQISGAVIAIGANEPLAFSGVAGDYSFLFDGTPLEFVCPSNGTYFMFVNKEIRTEYLRKAATE